VNLYQFSVGSVSFFISSPTCTCAEPVHDPSLHSPNTDRSLCTRKSTKIYPRPLLSLPHDPTPSPTSEGDWSVTKIVPPICIPLLHLPDHITILSPSREVLCSNNKFLTVRSPEHGDSIVHMYPIQCVLKSNTRAVIDTGAQRSTAKHSDVSFHTGSLRTACHNERYFDGLLNCGYSRNSSDPRHTR
jgi:hypothetical protein